MFITKLLTIAIITIFSSIFVSAAPSGYSDSVHDKMDPDCDGYIMSLSGKCWTQDTIKRVSNSNIPAGCDLFDYSLTGKCDQTNTASIKNKSSSDCDGYILSLTGKCFRNGHYDVTKRSSSSTPKVHTYKSYGVWSKEDSSYGYCKSKTTAMASELAKFTMSACDEVNGNYNAEVAHCYLGPDSYQDFADACRSLSGSLFASGDTDVEGVAWSSVPDAN